MKKERLVALCICVVLWGSLQSVCSMAVGVKLFQTSANSLTLRSSLAPAIVCAGWPPLGWFYGEMRLLNIQKRKPQLEAKKPASDGLAGYGIPARWPEHEKSR